MVICDTDIPSLCTIFLSVSHVVHEPSLTFVLVYAFVFKEFFWPGYAECILKHEGNPIYIFYFH